MENIIKCTNVTKKYDKNIVFSNLNIKINKGITGIVAPNGYGKTTFIEMCMGLLKEYTGNIKILDENIDNVRDKIGFVTDKPIFPKNLTVLDYINIVSKIYNKKYDDNIIKLFKINNVLNLKIKNLSAGYLKRLSFLLAVIHKPEIVFADEPFSNVDITAIKDIQKIILGLKESGVSFVISSHDLNELVEVADTVLIIINKTMLEIKSRKIEGTLIELSSDNINELYNYLKNDYNLNIDGNSLKFICKNLKKLFFDLYLFPDNIETIKTINIKEDFLNEVTKAIVKDRD